MLLFVLTAFLGHVLGALLLYANHRWILHGKLGATRYLRWAYRLHALHHKYAYPGNSSDSKRYHVFFSRTPAVVFVVLFLLVGIIFYYIPALGIGLSSAWIYYEFMHRAAHGFLRYSFIGKHHETHHLHPKTNFAGVYPWIDSIFKTSNQIDNKL